VRMHLLSGGRLRMRRFLYYPDAPREETIDLPVSCALFKHPQGNVLFDTGCHPSVADDAEGRWGSLARALVPIFEAREAVTAQLPLAGLAADDIDVVICSHLHLDHCGCNGFFRKATVLCHAREMEVALSPEARANGYFRIDWDNDRPVETFEAQRDLFGDGRLTLLPMPGHTPGMTTLHAALDRDGAFLLASDAAAVRENLDQRYAPRNTWNIDLAVNALDEIARFRRDGATVLFGHDDAQWRDIRKGAAFFE